MKVECVFHLVLRSSEDGGGQFNTLQFQASLPFAPTKEIEYAFPSYSEHGARANSITFDFQSGVFVVFLEPEQMTKAEYPDREKHLKEYGWKELS